MTFLEAAIEVLKQEGKPLQARDLTRVAIKQNLLSVVGRDPEGTMLAQLQAAIRRGDEGLVQTSNGAFGLRIYPPRPQAQPAREPTSAPRPQERARGREGRKKDRPEAMAEAMSNQQTLQIDDMDRDPARAPRGGRGRRREESAPEGAAVEMSSASTPAPTPVPVGGTLFAEAEEGGPLRRRRGGRAHAPGVTRTEEGDPAQGEAVEAAPAQAPAQAEPGMDMAAAASHATPAVAAPVQEESSATASHAAPEPEPAPMLTGADVPEPTGAGAAQQDQPGALQTEGAQAGAGSDAGAPGAGGPGQPASPEGGPKEPPPRIMAFAEAVIDVLRGSSDGRPMHFRQITDVALKRRLVRGEAADLWRALRTAVVRDQRQRDTEGLRARIKHLGQGQYLLLDKKIEPELLNAEKELLDRLSRTKEAVRVALRRRLRALPPSAFELMMRLLLERLGMVAAELIKRGEGVAYYAGTQSRGARSLKVLCALRPGEAEISAQAVGELRAGVKLRGYDEGLLLGAGRASAAALAEVNAAPGIDLYDQEPLTDLLIKNQLGVRRLALPVEYIDVDLFSELLDPV